MNLTTLNYLPLPTELQQTIREWLRLFDEAEARQYWCQMHKDTYLVHPLSFSRYNNPLYTMNRCWLHGRNVYAYRIPKNPRLWKVKNVRVHVYYKVYSQSRVDELSGWYRGFGGINEIRKFMYQFE